MRMPSIAVHALAIGILAAAGSRATAQTPTVPADNPTVTGVIITNAGTYTGQSTSTPASAGQLSPTGTCLLYTSPSPRD